MGRYLAWSGLHQLRELVTLDNILCPTVPEELVAEDWQHNVHADYQTHHFRSLDYLRRRVAGETGVHILAALRDPAPATVEAGAEGFALMGFDLVDQTVDVSALTGCGGWRACSPVRSCRRSDCSRTSSGRTRCRKRSAPAFPANITRSVTYGRSGA